MLDKFFLQAKNQIMSQQKSDIDSIVMRINLRISELGIKAAEINRRLNKSSGWIYNLLKQERHSLIKNLDDIAEALECSSVWLQYGDPFPKDQFVSDNLQIKSKSLIHGSIAIGQPMGKIRTGKPILKLQEAHDSKTYLEVAMQDKTRSKILIYPDNPADVSDEYIPVLVENDAMLPDFKKGDLLIVDPKKQAKISNYVVARLLESSENIFAQYFIRAEDNKTVFKFTNSDYPVIVDPDKVAIIGVVAESRKVWI